jgi:AcrR family transcriptional regulator
MQEHGSAGAKGTKRQRTRARLVEAAAQLIGEKGFERTSLEEVAAKAGMTRGAIYGNFRDKDELFMAVVAARWQPILPPARPGASFSEQMRLVADAVVAAMPSRRAAAVGAASFQSYALTHEEIRRRMSEANAGIYRQMEEGLRHFAGDGAPPLPPEMFVRVAHALVDGLMFLHALTPDLIDERVVYAAFELLGAK